MLLTVTVSGITQTGMLAAGSNKQLQNLNACHQHQKCSFYLWSVPVLLSTVNNFCLVGNIWKLLICVEIWREKSSNRKLWKFLGIALVILWCWVLKWRCHFNLTGLCSRCPYPSHSTLTRWFWKLPSFQKGEQLRMAGQNPLPSHSKHHHTFTEKLFLLPSFWLDIIRRVWWWRSAVWQLVYYSTVDFNGLSRLPITMHGMPKGLTSSPKSSVQLSSTSLWI